jgi:uncharacterized protein GlcG (DUF336 family)
MAKLTLEQADKIIAGALAKAAEMKLNPLTIAVLDDGGHLKAFKRQDGPGAPLRPFVAIGKAFGAVGMGASTRVLEQRAKDRPHFFGALSDVSQGRMVPVPGGVLVRDSNNEVIGSVGVSGDTSDNDEAAALAGIASAGLKSDA